MDEPGYIALHRSGELARHARLARERLAACDLCPRSCGVDRLAGDAGFCGVADGAAVASSGPHFGEEAPLVGRRGSGTVFFFGCNLGCAFCQNADISTRPGDDPLAPAELSAVFLRVQRAGCHNLNLVTPTHVLPQILAALDLAIGEGLAIPIVWNCGGYEALSALALLDGVVDVYMPDLKAMDPGPADALFAAADYPVVAKAAILEMRRQVGDLRLDAAGIARRGLLVRHLVLPGDLSGAAAAVRFLAEEVSPGTYLNVMDQYRPCHRAIGDPILGAFPEPGLVREAKRLARAAGLRLDE